jgi:single-strand DNA-binding protein
MSTELHGTVHNIEETQTFESGFQKRTLVINNGEQYRPYIAIDFLKDRIDLLDKYKVGDAVSVSVNIGNDYYKDKLYNNISGWRIQASEGSTPAEPSGKVKPATPHEAFGHEKKSFAEETDELDDLGF